MDARSGNAQRKIAETLVALGRWAKSGPCLGRWVYCPSRVLGDVREELEVQPARDCRCQFLSQAQQLWTDMRVNLLHPFVEAVNIEDPEIHWSESERCHFFVT